VSRKSTLIASSVTLSMLSGCTSDIVAKSDYGEEIIIKPSSISHEEAGLGSWLSSATARVTAIYSDYYDCIAKNYGELLCRQSWLDKERDFIDKKNTLESLQKRVGSPLIKARYRALVKDVNNNKAASEWTEIYCTKKSVTKEEKNLLVAINDWNIPQEDGTVGAAAISGVCNYVQGKY